MSDNKIKVNVDNSSGVGFLAIVIWIIAFWGEPDLIDAIKFFLMGGD